MAGAPRFDDLRIGSELPSLELPPISRTTLAYFAGSSGDRNPIHLDIDHARSAGHPDVFVHGMFVMASAARLLTAWAGPTALRSLEARFMAITQVGERLRCSARITGMTVVAAGGEIELAVEVRNEKDEPKLTGRAVVSLA